MKIALYKIILCLILIKLYQSNCNTGCLQCSLQGNCKFCDFTNNYFLEDGICNVKEIPNCLITAVDGTCLQCIEEYYFEQSTQKCQQVPLQIYVENCKFYSSSLNCVKCKENYYILNNTCNLVEQNIENCIFYNSKNTCLECKDNFTLSFDKKNCEQYQDSNCLLTTSLKCTQCKTGYTKDNNYHINNLRYKAKNSNSIITAMNIFQTKQVFSEDICQLPKVYNCQRFLSFFECDLCEFGYFNQNGKCIKNPINKIANCASYKTITVCEQCIPGYYLQTPTFCQRVEEIENCLHYDTSSYYTKCQICENEYYLHTNNSCVKRVNIFEECLQYQLNDDKCNTCISDTTLIVHPKGNRCFQRRSNCQEYFDDDKVDIPECKFCNEGYYVKHGNCIKGSVKFCKVYERVQNQCSLCEDGYYLNVDRECYENQEILNCNVLNPFRFSYCDQCQNQFILFHQMNQCEQIYINNCKIAKSKTECFQCEDFYNLNQDLQCEDGSILNCKIEKFNRCEKCSIGFALHQEKCVSIETYKSQQCIKDNLNGLIEYDKYKCYQCSEFSEPINLKNNFLCLSKNEFKLFVPYNPIQYCIMHYRNFQGIIQCKQCAQGYIPHENGTCVTTCNSDIYKWQFGQQNSKLQIIGNEKCSNTTSQDCSIYTPLLIQNKTNLDVQQSCAVCRDNYIKYIEYNNQQTLISNEVINNWPVLKSIHQCLPKSTSNIIEVNNCEYYAMFPDDQRRCVKCNFQNSGVIKAWKVDHCRTYDYELRRCIECLPGYLLKKNPDNTLHYHICVNEYEIVPNCASLSYNNDKCYLCQAGYYLSNNGQTCTQFSISQCQILSHNSQTCDKCNDNYQLKSDNTTCLLIPSNCITVNDSGNCIRCKRGYNLNQSQCVLNDCYIYNKDYSECLQYKNKVFYTETNQCVTAPFDLTNCIKYNKYRNCIQCTGHFYVQNGVCVAVTAQVSNCYLYKNISGVKCVQCEDDHTLQERDNKQYCVPFSKYVESNVFYSGLNFSYQDLNCNVFDLDKWKCQSCDNDTYNSKGICCDDNKININGTCQTLNQITNCERIQYYQNQYTCIQCAQTFTKAEGICCTATQFNFNGKCTNLSDYNCSKWDQINGRCDTCIANYYKIKSKQHCCNQGFYHDQITCIQMTNTIPYKNCLQFDIDTNQCIKCQVNHFFNGKECILTTKFTDNCLQYNNDQYQNLCIKCNNNYKLINNQCCSYTQYLDNTNQTCTNYNTPIINCKIMDENNNCQQCNNDYFLLNNNLCCADYSQYTSTTCLLPWTQQINNCAYHDPQNKNCYYCLSTETQQYYLSQDTLQVCCQEGQKYNSSTGLCVDIAITQCIQQNGSNCIKCKEGYLLNNNQCTQPITNCAQYDSTTCIKCQQDYLLYISTNQSATFCLSKSNFNKVEYQNCQQLNYVDSLCTQGSCDDTSANIQTCYECYTCNKCDQYSYSVQDGDRIMCVNYGYQLLSQSKTQIKKDILNCAVYDYSTTKEQTKCTQCYYNTQYQHLYTDEIFQIIPNIQNNKGLSYESEFKLLNKNDFIQYNYNMQYLYNDQCVGLGNYLIEGQEVSIEIDNCLILDNNNKCIKCQSGYSLHGNGIKCCSYDSLYNSILNKCIKLLENNCDNYIDKEGNKYYLSNEHCCQESSYWNQNIQQCVQNIDQNCLRTQDGIRCQLCKDNFYKQNVYSFKAVQNNFNLNSQNIRNFYQQVYLCIQSNKYTYTVNQITDFQKLINQIQIQNNSNCKVYDTQTIAQCIQCKEGYYQMTQSDLCCAYGQVHISYQGQYICGNITQNNLDCLVYNYEEKKCQVCKTYYTNYDGYCCNRFSYFNNETKQCVEKVKNCESYDSTQRECIQCDDGYYITNQQCCKLGYYYDSISNTCIQIQVLGIQNCQKLYQDQCKLCQQGYYLSNQKCCLQGYYNNNGICENINQTLGDGTLHSGYFGCQILDEFQNCQSCQNSYLINGRCCQQQYFFNNQNPTCVYGNIQNCQYYDSFQNCLTCQNNYYLSNGICCQNGSINISNTCQYLKPNLQYYNIDHYNKHGEIICAVGYNLQYVNPTDIQCQPILQTDPNCLKYTQEFPTTTCQICKPDYIPNGSSDPTNSATCDQFTMTGCEIIQTNQSGPPNEICQRCLDNYLPSYSNNFVDGCIEANFNCQYYEVNTSNCELCFNNYYVDKDDSFNCKQISTFNQSVAPGDPTFQKECLIGSKQGSTLTCLRCIENYYLNGGQCEIIQQSNLVFNCLYYSNTQQCDICNTNYYLDNNKCCHESISPTQCNNDDEVFRDILNCEKFAKFDDGLIYCEKCNNGFYEINDGCCPNNKLFDGFECVNITSEGLDQCLQYENAFECKMISDQRISNCNNNYYYTYQHCCQLGQYWDYTQSKCDNILQSNCDMLDEDGICIQCNNNKYPSYGYCCDIGDYFNGKECVSIQSIQNCDKFDNDQCIQCSSNYDHQSGDARCCSKESQKYFWNQYTNTCTQVHVNCEVFDFQNNICQNCQYFTNNMYLSELSCCPDGQYYNPNTNQCDSISNTTVDSTCDQLQPFNINLKICERCNTNGIFQNEKCCIQNELNLIEYDKCLKNEFFENCQILNRINSCQQCNDNYNLYEYQSGRQLCCQDGQLFDQVQNKCIQGFIEGCLHYQDSQNCLICSNTRYLLKVNSDYDKCINIGYNNQSTFILENCIQFDNNNKCLSCKQSYQLFTNTNSQKCCLEGLYYNEDISLDCISTTLLFQNCSNFDFNKMQCLNCNDNFVLSKHICCTSGQVAVNGVCKQPEIQPSCLSYDINSQCIECANSYYIADGKCCPVNTVINLTTRECVQANDYCEEFTGYNFQKCKKCNSYSYENSIGKCCQVNQYWDQGTQSCKVFDDQRVSNCQGLEMIDNYVYCLGCKSDTFILSEDKTFCCQADQYFVNNQCTSSTNVPSSCKKFDQDNLLCTECTTGYYLYNGKCVQRNYYIDNLGIKNILDNLTINKVPNCTGFDIYTGQCLDCADKYYLYKGYCIKIPLNCKSFDMYLTHECQICEDNYYVSNGQCCKQEHYYDLITDETCKEFHYTNLAMKNCLEQKNNLCSKCKDDFYLNNGYCCQENYYWDVENQQCQQNQELLNCQQFGNSKFLCNKCDSGYVLIKTKTGKSKCMQLPNISNCQDYEIDVQNKYRCKECQVTQTQNYIIQEIAVNAQTQSTYSYPVSKNLCLYEDFRITLVQSSFQCIICNDNTTHYVYEGECIQRQLNNNCADTQESYVINKDRCTQCNEGYYVNDYNYCSEIPIEGCLIFDKEINICIKCQAPKKLHYFQNNHNQIISECVLIDQNEKLPPYFYPSYMETCTLENTCKNEKFVNLDGLLDQFFSCHKCIDNSKIPFASVQGGKSFTNYPTALQNFNLNQALTNKILNENEGGKLSECLAPSQLTFNVNFINFPTNCALGMINSDKIANAGNNNLNYQSLSTLSIFCVACKSGYKPRRNKTFPLQIEQCQVIPNCQSSIDDQFVNKCYQCEQNYIFGYTEEGIDYSKCIDWSQNMPNCYAGVNDQCMICQKGYYLNKDNICVTLQAHFCGESTFFQYQPILENLQVRLFQSPQGIGCTQCSNNQLGYFIEKDHYVCSYSNTMQEQKYKNQNSQYPNGCKIFGMVNNQMLCKECYGVFIMTKDYTCISKQQLSNCQIAIDEQRCQQCIDTYITIDYKCKQKDIEQCNNYEQNPQLLSQICKGCNNGYYLKDNKCIKGEVKDCKVYDQEGRCIQCIEQYGFIILKDNEQRCVKNLKDPKCMQYDSKWLQEGYFICTQCENTMQMFFQLNRPNSICSSIPVINNCLLYDVQKLFINSSLRCQECERPFYSTGLQCMQRQFMDTNCIKFNLFDDKCSKCKENYYLDDQMINCVLIPEGVPGCFEYITQNECKICNRQLYLKDNNCTPVPTNNLIPNCKIYKNQKECMICEEFYFLTQNKCFKKTDPNCLEHLDQNTCLKCKNNFLLTQNVKDNIQQVICIQPEDIESCQQISYVDQKRCQICIKDFYQVDGVCQAIKSEDIITNCNIYNIDKTCQQCVDNHVLLEENGKQICKQNSYVNGCQSFIKTNPFCVLCKNGYYVDGEGKCVKQNEEQISGCMYYDQLNNTCTACYPGYIHNKQQQCVPNITPQPVQLLSDQFLKTFTIVLLILFN